MKFRSINLLALGLLFFLTVSASAATFTVTKIADTNDGVCDSDCSFREAVAAANAAPGDDVIAFDAAVFGVPQTIVLSGTEIIITANGGVTINGPGAELLTIDGNLTSRIITVELTTAAIDGITFTRGNGVSSIATGRAGAIYNAGGNLTITRSVITGNSATNGGGLNNSSAGSPAVPAVLSIDNSIVSNNTASASGGGMQNFSTSTVSISNSTFVGNVSNGTTGGGGGQFNGRVNFTNVTFANNSAPAGSGGGFQSNGTLGTTVTNVTVSGNSSLNNGGGIHRGTTNVNFFIRNSIVAGNNGTAASPDVTNSANGLQSQGNNLIGNVGTSTGWVASDLLNTAPVLGPLADNGGFGQTFLPQAGSPAIDGGQNCVLDATCSANNAPINVNFDQRGVARPQGASVDIGSVEVAASSGAPAIVAGRVAAPSGFGLSHAGVSITDGTNVWNARTSSFGYFRFDGLPTGVTYTITVSDKRAAYGSTEVVLTGDVTDLEITPQVTAK